MAKQTRLAHRVGEKGLFALFCKQQPHRVKLRLALQEAIDEMAHLSMKLRQVLEETK